jgi:hypothetical protein
LKKLFLKHGYFLFCVFVFAVAFTSCRQKAVSSGTHAEVVRPVSDGIKKVTVDSKFDPSAIGGVVTRVDSLSMNGNLLSVFVAYGGGCQTHDFELFASGISDMSSPPEEKVYLKHISNSDKCRKLIFRELKFDVSALKRELPALKIALGDKSVVYK